MNKFRNIPAVITLLAGFVVSVIMILNKFTLVDFLWILVCVMAGFYFAGILLRVILNKAFATPKEESADDEETEDDGKSEGEDEKSDSKETKTGN